MDQTDTPKETPGRGMRMMHPVLGHLEAKTS
jgi:hypothetical protein